MNYNNQYNQGNDYNQNNQSNNQNHNDSDARQFQQSQQFQQPQQPFQQSQPFQQPSFQQPQQQFQQPTQPEPIVTPGQITLPFIEQSYIENILRLNRGKLATFYMNYENSQWGSKIFKGIIEEAGKDHIIIKDPTSEMRYMLLTLFLNYVTFEEEIEYFYPFEGYEEELLEKIQN